MSRFVCIHGHFYQPPRENPWLEEVETEDSAYPYHDWNERITAECYAPNAASRILDSDKRIIDIVNNYARISFDFGPTLLTWLEQNRPEVYSSILEADRDSIQRFSGHGSAIAQAYNHMIMPLASSRDKRTQVIWGIKDFVFRFKRRPEGMWLPETAVDLETLEILAEEKIAFTILSPKQASRIRPVNGTVWTDVKTGTIDCSRPYLCLLPSGASIAIFFYEEDISQELAFSSLLENGDAFAGRMMRYFSQYNRENGLLNIASDGETYGHHHRFADMALAYALYLIESKDLARITVYGEYLSIAPPAYEVEIRENTSWSCPHGIERWRSDCGCCNAGSPIQTAASHPLAIPLPKDTSLAGSSCDISAQQKWRSPLREAMDELHETLVSLCTNRMTSFVGDPWKARDDYIDVILDRSPENIERFFTRHASRDLLPDEKVQVLKLLELQRNGMLMYTSCGWFFDDISGIESVQVMRYACRAMQLIREVADVDPEPAFIDRLKKAHGNLPAYPDGAVVYRSFVRTAIVDLSRVGFHYALSSLITDIPENVRIKNYTLRTESYEKTSAGNLKLALGKVYLYSNSTWEENTLMFAVLHLGDHNFKGGACEYMDENMYFSMREELMEGFSKSDIPRMILCLEEHFAGHSYSLWDLFRDGKRKVLYAVLKSTFADMDSACRQIYRQHSPLLYAMKAMQIPPPTVLEGPIWYIINRDLEKALSAPDPDVKEIRHLAEEMMRGNFEPDTENISFTASTAITNLMKHLRKNPDDLLLLEKITGIFTLLAPLSLTYNLSECQNYYFRIEKETGAGMLDRKKAGESHAQEWVRLFNELGTFLGVKFL